MHIVSFTIACWLFVPIAALLFTVFTGKNDTVTNITFLFNGCVSLLQVAADLFPGDLILAAVLILYLKKYRVAGALGIASGFVFLYCKFSGALITNCISGLDPNNPLALVIKSIFGGFTVELLLLKWALPAIVALKRNKEKKKLYLWLTVLTGWMPPIWIALTFLAFRDDKSADAKKNEKGDKAKAAKPAAPKKLSKKKLRKRKY